MSFAIISAGYGPARESLRREWPPPAGPPLPEWEAPPLPEPTFYIDPALRRWLTVGALVSVACLGFAFGRRLA